MKLKVKTTRTLTTDELEVYCEPVLTFEAVGNVDPQTHDALKTWAQAKYPADQAVNFVPKLFLSVAENGTSYPLNTEGAARELQAVVGDAFLAELVENFWNYDYFYFQKKQAASANLSTPLPTTEESEATP